MPKRSCPDRECSFKEEAPDWMEWLLSSPAIQSVGKDRRTISLVFSAGSLQQEIVQVMDHGNSPIVEDRHESSQDLEEFGGTGNVKFWWVMGMWREVSCISMEARNDAPAT